MPSGYYIVTGAAVCAECWEKYLTDAAKQNSMEITEPEERDERCALCDSLIA
jgi:hypothetical protein